MGPARRNSILAVMATQSCQAATANRETEMNRPLSDFLQTVHLEPLKTPSRDWSDEARSDSAHIISSPPFPHLRAAQILSHEINSGARTQPTHPMKVARSVRILARNEFKSHCPRGMIEKGIRVPLIGTVENMCLSRYIGSPRFGHFGEYTIPASTRPVIMGGLRCPHVASSYRLISWALV